MRVLAEGTRSWVMDAHLAKGSHNEINHHATNEVADDDRRSGGCDRVGCSVEQTGSDRAAQGDELDVSIAQAAMQLLVGFGHGV